MEIGHGRPADGFGPPIDDPFDQAGRRKDLSPNCWRGARDTAVEKLPAPTEGLKRLEAISQEPIQLGSHNFDVLFRHANQRGGNYRPVFAAKMVGRARQARVMRRVAPTDDASVLSNQRLAVRTLGLIEVQVEYVPALQDHALLGAQIVNGLHVRTAG